MNRKKLLYRLTTLICFIFLINIIAHKLYWYSSIEYFDMIMHALGGVFLLFAIVYVTKVDNTKVRTTLYLLFGVLFVGFLWEVFEYIVNNVLAGQDFDIVDTLSDLVCDTLGGMLGFLYVGKRIMINKEDKL